MKKFIKAIKDFLLKFAFLVKQEKLLSVSTLRCGLLEKGTYVICNGYFGKLHRWTTSNVTVKLLCYTVGTKATYDRSCSTTYLTVPLDQVRSAASGEIQEYLP